MAQIDIFIDEKPVKAESTDSILTICRKEGVEIPTMCHMEGLTDVGACRLCIVEVEGSPRLFPACTTTPAPNMRIKTQTDKLKKYRRMITELMFSERNHICAVCVANGNCELQKLGFSQQMDSVRYPYLQPKCDLDASHPKYVTDHNRCILCTRCVRTCDEIEGAHNWDVFGRGHQSRVISDFSQPWGESTTCTSCGKCTLVCPTGTLWAKGSFQGHLHKDPAMVSDLAARRANK
jgi:bidirectional [NiFe] hydrogenase diaphorase subunit